MVITLSEFYIKLKHDLDHYTEAYEDYVRLRWMTYIMIAAFFFIGFALGFILKAWYL